MNKYNLYLYDDIGRKYERKNLYIKDLAILQETVVDSNDDEKPELKKKLKLLINKKDKHPYNIKIREFKKEESKFLSDLDEKEEVIENELSKIEDKEIRNLKKQLMESEIKYDFYKKHSELSYEIELKEKKNKIVIDQLPQTIRSLQYNKEKLERLKVEKKNIDSSLERKAREEFKVYKAKEKNKLNEEIKKLKEERKKGLISKKAQANITKELKQKYKTKKSIRRSSVPKRANMESIKNIKNTIKNISKQNKMVLNANIADLRRNTPVETIKTRPIYAYTTFFLPGLGQLLNKQYRKAIMFFIASVFVYLIAIPYALGYANYQGEGIYGLISLAEGGLRIDKSLIFMIEGIIAIFLLIIAIFLIISSFRDVRKVEKSRIRGTREKNWFETKMLLKEEGFPYLVSSPAFLIIIFIVLVPIMTTFLLSFTGMDPNHQSKFGWVGIENYKLILLGEGLAGSVFWLILGWTVVWTLVATTLAILIGFILALLVNNERVRFKGFFRTIYILPWAVPAFITIMFFSIMLSPDGSLTQILNRITGSRIEVKNNANLTRIALIMLQGWLGSAYVFLLSTGVLQAIPKDLYEAADIDGATSWQKTLKITIPLVLFQTAPLLVTQYTFNFNNFSIIYLFNGGGPFNPNLYGNLAGSSDLLISYIYKLTIENQYQAIGAAITIFISIGLMFFAYLGFRSSKGFKEGKL